MGARSRKANRKRCEESVDHSRYGVRWDFPCSRDGAVWVDGRWLCRQHARCALERLRRLRSLRKK